MLSETTLVYGEIDFQNFLLALEKVKFYEFIFFNQIKKKYGGLSQKGGVFYDLGSGSGKAVFAAALYHPFKKCVGYEILENLHNISMILKDKWEKEIAPTLDAERQATGIINI